MPSWRLERIEPLVERWVLEDAPSWELRCDLLAWLRAIRADPYRPGTDSVPGMNEAVRVAPLPGHEELAVAYLVDDEQRVITALLIEST